MIQPGDAAEDIAAMPPLLRALLEAELAAGNEIVEVGHSSPAPPVGAYFTLARPVTTRVRESGGGLDFYDRNSSLHSGEFTDERRFFWVLEPPHPEPPEPDMDTIHAAHEPVPMRVRSSAAVFDAVPDDLPNDDSAAGRFRRSTVIDYEAWHDGTGYDLEALLTLRAADRRAVEQWLVARAETDWRDVEALAALDTPTSRRALRNALRSPDHTIRNAVTQYAPQLVSAKSRTASLVAGLETGVVYGGLSQTLDQIESYHPAPVIDALFRGALQREGEVAVLLAAMLVFVHGKAETSFDWDQRPFFLRFHTEDHDARAAVFRELSAQIDVDPEPYLAG